MKDTELADWAAEQPLDYELVEVGLVLQAEHHQALSRLATLRHADAGQQGRRDQAFLRRGIVMVSLDVDLSVAGSTEAQGRSTLRSLEA